MDLGMQEEFVGARRIVSLVPSLTEALFSLGMGERVVGVTDWCVHPADGVASLPKVGGTKTPDLDLILELSPDLVIANREENRKSDVRRLQDSGFQVWVTYPRTVREGAELLRDLAGLGASPEATAEIVNPTFRELERAEASLSVHRTRIFCPIWKDPWMSVGQDTYAHNMLSLCGGENVFARHSERRYPRVTLDQVVEEAPEVILLPDEPYKFDEIQVGELSLLDVPAAASGRIHLIDGTLVTWYGPRIGQAIRILMPLLDVRA